MQRKTRIGGSPHPETCTNIDSCGTANNSSPCEMIRAATAEHRTLPVPLYLIPQAISKEIHRIGDALDGIRVDRTAYHNYAIIIQIRGEGGHD